MYVSFRKYKTTKERRKKTTKLRSARYICAGEVSLRHPSEGTQGSHPFDFALERDPENIFYYQLDVENYTDQVLNFLLFDRHEYIQ